MARRGVLHRDQDQGARRLALLWQIYSRCCFSLICLLQYGHRCGRGRKMSSTMAWRTAGRLGWGDGPLILFFPPRLCETAMLEECVGDHGHECTPMDRRSGSRTWVSSTFQETKRGSSVNTGCRERRNIISPICRLKRGPKRGEASFQPTLGAVSPTHILPLGIGQHVFGRPRQDVRNVPLAGDGPDRQPTARSVLPRPDTP